PPELDRPLLIGLAVRTRADRGDPGSRSLGRPLTISAKTRRRASRYWLRSAVEEPCEKGDGVADVPRAVSVCVAVLPEEHVRAAVDGHGRGTATKEVTQKVDGVAQVNVP